MHHLSSIFLKIFSRFYRFKQTSSEVKGLKVKNKLGLAAGMDKNGEIIDQMDHIGFGFIEIGTVTPKPQYGNPKPRLKRLVKEESLINSLGFNNKGADSLLKRLANRNKNITLGINIGPIKTLSIKFITYKVGNITQDCIGNLYLTIFARRIIIYMIKN